MAILHFSARDDDESVIEERIVPQREELLVVHRSHSGGTGDTGVTQAVVSRNS